jgi:predicted permease
MAHDADSYIVPLLGALQASIAVLLTIFSGVLGAQFKLLSEESSKEISRMSINIFMPALLITSIGSQLHLETVHFPAFTPVQTVVTSARQ